MPEPEDLQVGIAENLYDYFYTLKIHQAKTRQLKLSNEAE